MLDKTAAVIYQPASTSQGEPTRDVTGQWLAKNRVDARGRARLAAEIIAGRVKIRKLTIGQTARLCRVSVRYVTDARRPPAKPETLAEHLIRTAPAEWTEAARKVGVTTVWDRMIAPLV